MSDHVKQTQDLLEFADKAPKGVASPTARLTAVTAAGVHATLALVEQQRIANEIAVIRLGASALDEVAETKATVDTTRQRVRRFNALRARIKEGLGL